MLIVAVDTLLLREEFHTRANPRSVDGKRFRTAGLSSVELGATEEVAMAVSVSYQVIAGDVQSVIGDIHFVELALDEGSPDCH